MTKRKHIRSSTETEVLTQSGRRCCICFGLHRDFDLKQGQIAHLDRNNQNNKFENLAFLCLEHHDMYDTTTSQSKGWTPDEVKKYRDLLYKAVREDLERFWLQSEKSKSGEMCIWRTRLSAIHYLNVHRVIASFAAQGIPIGLSDIGPDNLQGLRGLGLDQYAALMTRVRQLLRDWQPEVLDLDNHETIRQKNLGARVGFTDIRFRTKSIPSLVLAESNTFKLTGTVEEDPHIHCRVGRRKVYLPINPLWITTDTAFGDFKPASGITAHLAGLGILKYVDDEIAIITPLVIGLPDPFDWLPDSFGWLG